MRRAFTALVLAAALASLLCGAATACTIDGKASAYANNVEAVIAYTAPTVATYRWWAHFIFPRAFHEGERILFRENDAQVRAVLPRANLSRSWRWRFGDGAALVGDHAGHIYRRAGRYRVSVDAYFPGLGWQQFDAITIAVRRSAR